MLSDAEQETMSVSDISEDEVEMSEEHSRAEQFFQFVDFETHQIDVDKIPEDVRQGMPEQSSALFHPYHPEIFAKIAEQEPGLEKALLAYQKRESEFPGKHMVADYLSSSDTSLGRWRSKSAVKLSDCGIATRNFPLETMKRKFTHAVLQQYDYYDIDIRSSRLSIFNNFVQHSSKYTEKEKKCMQSFLKYRDVWFQDFVKELKTKKPTPGEEAFTKEYAKEILVACTNGSNLGQAIYNLRVGNRSKSVWNQIEKGGWFQHERVEGCPKVSMKSDKEIEKQKSYQLLKRVCELMEKVSRNLYDANSGCKLLYDMDAKKEQCEQENETKTEQERAVIWQEQFVPRAYLSLSSRVYEVMECMTIYRIFFRHCTVTTLFNRRTLVYSFDGVAVQLRPEVTIDSFMEEVNNVAVWAGLTFVNKPWLPLDEEWKIPKNKLAKLPWSKEESVALLKDAMQRGEEAKKLAASKKRGADQTQLTTLKKGCRNVKTNDQYIQAYEQWKVTWEREFCKITGSKLYIQEHIDDQGEGELVYFNHSEIMTMFRHYGEYVQTNALTSSYKSFVDEWTKDPTARIYQRMDCIPPGLPCPANVYNTWTPFPYESSRISPSDPEWNQLAVDHMLGHIYYIIDEPEVRQYLTCWIADMFQNPHIKPGVMIVMISQEGAGKGTLVDILRDIVGQDKTLETKSPEIDVWGTHSTPMLQNYLVLLSEIDKSNMHHAYGKIKALLTDIHQTCNPKNQGIIKYKSYHRFILPTNGISPCITSDTDRRSLIVRLNDCLIKKFEYFDNLREILRGPNALRSIYWYFRTLDITGWDRRNPPRTEYHQKIIEIDAKQHPVDKFLQHLIHRNPTEPAITFLAADLFSRFKEFCDYSGVSMEGKNMRIILNHIKLQKFPENAFVHSHTRTGEEYVVNLSVLKDHYYPHRL